MQRGDIDIHLLLPHHLHLFTGFLGQFFEVLLQVGLGFLLQAFFDFFELFLGEFLEFLNGLLVFRGGLLGQRFVLLLKSV